MSIAKAKLALGFVTTVAACGHTPDITSRNAPFEIVPEAITPVASAPLPAALSVSQVNVAVPAHLKVSEANRYYPTGDIVWRGEPYGDRHAQVQRIIQEALSAGTAGMAGDIPVTLDVTVVRFHSLSEKARYTIGGVHNIVFDLTVRRASTGEPLAPPHRVVADLNAFGGKDAVNADKQGLTQKVRIHAFLQQVIREELSRFVAG